MEGNLNPCVGDSCKKTKKCKGKLISPPNATFLECSVCGKKVYYVTPVSKQNQDQ